MPRRSLVAVSLVAFLSSCAVTGRTHQLYPGERLSEDQGARLTVYPGGGGRDRPLHEAYLDGVDGKLRRLGGVRSVPTDFYFEPGAHEIWLESRFNWHQAVVADLGTVRTVDGERTFMTGVESADDHPSCTIEFVAEAGRWYTVEVGMNRDLFDGRGLRNALRVGGRYHPGPLSV